MNVFSVSQNWKDGTPLVVTELFKDLIDMALSAFLTKMDGPGSGIFVAGPDGMIVALVKDQENMSDLVLQMTKGEVIMAGFVLWKGGEPDQAGTDFGSINIMAHDGEHAAKIRAPMQKDEDGEWSVDMSGWVVSDIPSIADQMRPKIDLSSEPNLN